MVQLAPQWSRIAIDGMSQVAQIYSESSSLYQCLHIVRLKAQAWSCVECIMLPFRPRSGNQMWEWTTETWKQFYKSPWSRLQCPEWHQLRDAIARVRTQNTPRGAIGNILPFWASMMPTETVAFFPKPRVEASSNFILLNVSDCHRAATP